MRPGLTILLSALALSFSAVVVAGPIDYLFRDKRICVEDDAFCFRGSLSYRFNPRLLRLHARVQKAPGPGMLRITVVGTNELGHPGRAPIEVRVRGKHSEIIDHKLIPDYPDVHNWEVERIVFVAD